MNEQHQEVQLWLEGLFAGGDVPEYEVNKTTIGILYKLMKQNKSLDCDTQLIIDDYRQKAQEYRSEASRLKNMLRCMNMTLDSLSKPGMTNLRTLACVALHLQTTDTEELSYYVALGRLYLSLFRISEERKEQQRKLDKLSEKTRMALLKHTSLERSLDFFKQHEGEQISQTEKKAKELGFVNQKIKEYRDKISKMEGHLSKIGVDSSIYHGELVKKSEELEAVKKGLAPIQATLQLYHSLPPDVPLTKVRVEEMRQKLAALEADLQAKINVMHM